MSPASPAVPGVCHCAVHPAGSRSSPPAVARSWSAWGATTGALPPELHKAALTALAPAAAVVMATARTAPWPSGNGGCAPPPRTRRSIVWGRGQPMALEGEAGRLPHFMPGTPGRYPVPACAPWACALQLGLFSLVKSAMAIANFSAAPRCGSKLGARQAGYGPPDPRPLQCPRVTSLGTMYPSARRDAIPVQEPTSCHA